MRSIRHAVALLSLSCAVCAADWGRVAWSQDRLPGFGQPPQQPPLLGFGKDARNRARVTSKDRAQAESVFSKYDRNRDGVLGPKEIIQTGWGNDVVRQNDLNRDGRIPIEEMALRYANYRVEQATAARRKRIAAIEQANKQKRTPPQVVKLPIDPATLRRTQMCSSVASELVGRYDRNGNKQLEVAECLRVGQYGNVSGADRDGDQVVTHAELTTWLTRRLPPIATSRLAPALRLLDVNHDGQIAMDEFAQQWDAKKLRSFQLLDKNADGVISATESNSSPTPRRAIRHGTSRPILLNPGNRATSTIYVEDDSPIQDLDIQIALTKQVDFQLRVTLQGPDGQQVLLYDASVPPWTGYVFEDILFDDEAERIATTLPRPPLLRRMPVDGTKQNLPGLKHFYDKSARGTWRLEIQNLNQHAGVLNRWALLVTPAR
ncbi:MAG: proprotein convertase P-domain-containing protein [Pirellulaceae bacterium]|jgi:subtilisin-like proprotein convertase family protein|nr:proprotein convertase P-domain-containing protein [Pirellulaceae bacterium]MDP7016978.1 proprotein convertase P-domain-containing protein [Pirellulaceae bacterium]